MVSICIIKYSQNRHPFTISSSPDEDFMSVHIRIVGDWTGDLYKLLNPNKKPYGIIQKNMINAPNGQPIFLVDGPFGTASADVRAPHKLSLTFTRYGNSSTFSCGPPVSV